MVKKAKGGQEVAAEITHAFGSCCGTGLRDAVLFGDDAGHYLAHPIGRHIAFRHVDTSEASFVVASPRVDLVTACTVSRDKSLLGVCEKCSSDPVVQVSVYDLNGLKPKLVKTLAPLGSSNGRLIGITFSGDRPTRFVGVITAGPQSSLLIMDLQDGQIVGRSALDTAADRVAFSPHDICLIAASGPHLMRVSRMRSASSKVITDPEMKLGRAFTGLDEKGLRITDHAWVEPGDGNLVACTAEGKVFILSTQKLTVLTTLGEPFREASATPICVRCFSQGLLLGGGEGTLAVWEREDDVPGDGDEDKVQFRHVRTCRIKQSEAAIVSLDMAVAEESLVLGFRNAQIGYMSVASLYVSRASEISCKIASGGFHSGPVTCLDMAVQRPFVASLCNKDNSVRVWNHAAKTCEFFRTFSGDPPTSMALHPLGYLIAIGFGDKLRFYHVLIKELKPYCEFPFRQVRVLRFAHGGHLLAAAQGKLIHILSTRTFSTVATLQGHSHHITALSFHPEDHTLISGSQDGTLCEWNAQTWEKLHDHSSRSFEYLAASCFA